MTSVTLDRLAMAHDTAWRASHGTLLKEIPTAEAELEALWAAKVAAAQAAHDRWDRLASRVHPDVKGEGMRKKYNNRIHNRNHCGQLARAARERRFLPGEEDEEIIRQEAVVQSLVAEQAYRRRHYCEVRHRYLEAIYQAELGNAEAHQRKLEWMTAANISDVGAEEVRYYVHTKPDGSSEVHLFYGGRDGSPDGEGHAHHQLLVAQGGELQLVFQRLPAAE